MFRKIVMALMCCATLSMSFATSQAMLYKFNAEGTVDSTYGAPLINLGTGTAAVTNGGDYVNWVANGNQKFGTRAYKFTNGRPVLEDLTNGLGCSAETGFTLSFFINYNEASTWKSFFGFRIGNENVRIEKTDSANYMLYYNNGRNFATFTQIPMTQGTWQHLALVVTTGKIVVYLDGVQASTFTGTATISGLLTQLLPGRGRDGDGTTDGFKATPTECYFDEIAVFDAALTDTQIAWLAQNEAIADIPETLPAVETSVVRVHPYLTRGLSNEPVVGLRNLPAGTLTKATFDVELSNCTADQLGTVTLWKMPESVSEEARYEDETATITCSTPPFIQSQATALGTATLVNGTLTFASSKTITKSDALWLTVTLDPTLDSHATVTFVPTALETSLQVATLMDSTLPRAHALFPYRSHILAYYKGNATPTETEFAKRFPTLTGIYLIGSGSTYWNISGTAVTPSEAMKDSIQTFKTARDTYHPDMKVMACFSRSDAWKAAMTEANRAAFVESIVTLLTTYGLDGVDLDYEYPRSAAEVQNYTALVRELSEAFFPHGLILSQAACGNYLRPTNAANAALDFFNIMAYDGNSLNAPYSLMTAHINALSAAGYPARRMVVGQAIYGNDLSWKQPGWATIVATTGYINDDCDYLIWQGYHETFTGPHTYRAKVRYCVDQNYGGIMSWGYYSDVNWEHSQSLAHHQAQVIWPRRAYAWSTPETDAEGYYLLTNEEDWYWFTENPTHNVRLTCDITLTHDPKPVATFAGILDGAGYTLTLPKWTWIVTFDETGLFKSVTGTIKNLNVDIEGHIISRRDRKTDAGTRVDSGTDTITLSTQGGEGANVGGLTAALNSGGTLSNVHLTLGPSSLVRGQHEVGGLVGSFWGGADSTTTLTNCTVFLAGKLSTLPTNSLGTEISMTSNANGDVGALIGQFNWQGTALVQEATVTLDATAVIESKKGFQGGAGGCIGNVNQTLTTQVQNLSVIYHSNATVTSDKYPTTKTPYAQPWIATRNRGTDLTAGCPTLSGRIIPAGSGSLPWAINELWIATPVLTSFTAKDTGETLPIDIIENLLPSVPTEANTTIQFNNEREASAAVLFDITPNFTTEDEVTTATVAYAFGISKLYADIKQDSVFLTAKLESQDTAASLDKCDLVVTNDEGEETIVESIKLDETTYQLRLSGLQSRFLQIKAISRK